MNPFKIFLDSLYSLYSQSPKLQEELKRCADRVDGELRRIGRVLDTRWAASSLRTIKAIWTSFEALAAHFLSKQDGKDAARFKGMLRTLTSTNFVMNLAIMYDALEEVGSLSVLLQGRDMALITANKLIDQSIKALQAMVSKPGKAQKEAEEALATGVFKNVELCHTNSIAIKSGQFFQSLATNLSNRLLTTSSRKGEKASSTATNTTAYHELLSQTSLLDPTFWPSDYDSIPKFGEQEIFDLSSRFSIDAITSVRGFKLFKAVGGRGELNDMLLHLKNAVDCLPVSTAECERAFSVMNTIVTAKRNRLDLALTSSLMFISIVGPPIHSFKPTVYVKNWLRRGHHSAYDTASVKRHVPQTKGYYSHVFELLG